MAEVERGWCARTPGGVEIDYLYGSEANPDADFEDAAQTDVAAPLALWKAECPRADGILAGLAPEYVATRGPDAPSPGAGYRSIWWGSAPATTATPTCSENGSTGR